MYIVIIIAYVYMAGKFFEVLIIDIFDSIKKSKTTQSYNFNKL